MYRLLMVSDGAQRPPQDRAADISGCRRILTCALGFGNRPRVGAVRGLGADVSVVIGFGLDDMLGTWRLSVLALRPIAGFDSDTAWPGTALPLDRGRRLLLRDRGVRGS